MKTTIFKLLISPIVDYCSSTFITNNIRTQDKTYKKCITTIYKDKFIQYFVNIHPKIWLSIRKIQSEEFKAALSYSRMNDGILNRRGRNKVVKQNSIIPKK